MNDNVIAKDKIGGCRYVITIQGRMIVCTMTGYGLKATETQKISHRKGSHFNYDAFAMRDKMVALERRMRELARLTTVLQANHLTGVPRMTSTDRVRKLRGINPLTDLMSRV